MSTSSEITNEVVARELQGNFPTWLDRITADGLDAPEGNTFYVEGYVDEDVNKMVSFTVTISNTDYHDESGFEDDEND